MGTTTTHTTISRLLQTGPLILIRPLPLLPRTRAQQPHVVPISLLSFGTLSPHFGKDILSQGAGSGRPHIVKATSYT